jgi:hypothetical protein
MGHFRRFGWRVREEGRHRRQDRRPSPSRRHEGVFCALPTIWGNCETRRDRPTGKTGGMADDELDDWLEVQAPLTNGEKAGILYGFRCAARAARDKVRDGNRPRAERDLRDNIEIRTALNG